MVGIYKLTIQVSEHRNVVIKDWHIRNMVSDRLDVLHELLHVSRFEVQLRQA